MPSKQAEAISHVLELLETKLMIRFNEYSVAPQVVGEYADRVNKITLVHASPTPLRGPAETYTVLLVEAVFPRPWSKKLPDEDEPFFLRYDADLKRKEYRDTITDIARGMARTYGWDILCPTPTGIMLPCCGFSDCQGFAAGRLWLPHGKVLLEMSRLYEALHQRTRGIHPLEHEADECLRRLEATLRAATR